MMQKAVGNVFIPAEVWGREDLSLSEKVLYGRLQGLSTKQGYCFASNKYLAEDMDMSPRTIQRKLNKLKRARLLRVEIVRDENNEVKGRQIYCRKPVAEQDIASSDVSSRHECREGGRHERREGGANARDDDVQYDGTTLGLDNTESSVRVRVGENENGENENDEPPKTIQNLAFKLFGYVPPQLAQWYRFYPHPWIPRAMEKVRDRDVSAPVPYVKSILEDWRRAGGPPPEEVQEYRNKVAEAHRERRRKAREQADNSPEPLVENPAPPERVIKMLRRARARGQAKADEEQEENHE